MECLDSNSGIAFMVVSLLAALSIQVVANTMTFWQNIVFLATATVLLITAGILDLSRI